jgi:hypothetical protein
VGVRSARVFSSALTSPRSSRLQTDRRMQEGIRRRSGDDQGSREEEGKGWLDERKKEILREGKVKRRAMTGSTNACLSIPRDEPKCTQQRVLFVLVPNLFVPTVWWKQNVRSPNSLMIILHSLCAAPSQESRKHPRWVYHSSKQIFPRIPAEFTDTGRLRLLRMHSRNHSTCSGCSSTLIFVNSYFIIPRSHLFSPINTFTRRT